MDRSKDALGIQNVSTQKILRRPNTLSECEENLSRSQMA